MNIKKGFSLLSFLLYLVVFSTIAFCVCHIITILILPSFSAIKKSQSLISLHIAADFFVRDIHYMRENEYLWRLISPNEIIWHQNEGDRGWRFFNNCLERREGTYNGNGTWKNATTSLVAKNILATIFTVIKTEQHDEAIELTLVSQCAPQKPIICYVSLARGIK